MNDINWDNIITGALIKTDNEFAAELSGLTRLTDDELKAFVKTPAQKETFVKLISVIRDNTLDNNKKAEAINNIAGALEMIVPLLVKFV
ncbi:hypothetical protein ACFL0M_12985 [Thermodesulfobacteriota bacterium]